MSIVLSSCQAPVSPTPIKSQTPSQVSSAITPASPSKSPQTTPTAAIAPSVADINKPIIIEFYKSFNTLNKDWEAYRNSYGSWRQKDTCAEPAMTENLSKFIADFQKIRRSVNELPQTSLVRSVSELLAEAAEKEEAALTDLRSNWKPGEETVFQKYETGRLTADKIHRQATQNLNDLVLASQTESMEAIAKYRRGRNAIEVDWDTLQKDYNSWRQSLPSNSKDSDKDSEIAASEALQKLASNAQGILNRAYALTAPTLLQKSADSFVRAAEREEAAMRKLNTNWKPGDEGSLINYERERLAVNKLLRESTQGLEGLVAASLPGNKSVLEEFFAAYGKVNKAWNDFSSQYDNWRNKGGDCDRNSIRQQLSEQLGSFHGLALRVTALPQPAVVRPLAELMTQAAEREEGALRQLRDSWKPYDSSFYQTYEKEWVSIDRLRRQAAAGLVDLMQKNGISVSDIK